MKEPEEKIHNQQEAPKRRIDTKLATLENSMHKMLDMMNSISKYDPNKPEEAIE